MSSVWSDGLFMLIQWAAVIAAFFLAAWAAGLGIFDLAGKRWMTDGERRVMALPIGVAALVIPTYALTMAETVVTGALRFGGLGLLLVATGRAAYEFKGAVWRLNREGVIQTGLVTFGLGALLVLRLAFLSELLLPPYTDPVIHFQIVRGMLEPELASAGGLSLQNVLVQYYHFGFHSEAAWLSAVSGATPAAVLPVVGQLYLVVASISIGVLAHAVTRSMGAAIWAAVLGGIGWQMPAFAANWGRYPAMAAMATLPAVAAFALRLWPGRTRRRVMVALGLVLLGTTLLHTRALVVLALAWGSFWAARRLTPAEPFSSGRAIRFAVLYVISLAPLYYYLGEFYWALLPTVLVLAGLPFAFRAQPRIAIGAFIFSYLIWVVALAPDVSGGLLPTALNEQFVEMMLYMPLALLGGAGLSGVLDELGGLPARRVATAAMGAATAILALAATLSAYPDRCCNYVSDDDLRALDWLAAKTPSNSLVLTAALEDGGQYFGTDAGVWVQALTGRDTNRVGFNTDWATSGEIERLCQQGARSIYIYAGDQQWSFREEHFAAGAWATRDFGAGGVAVYRVTSCGGAVVGPLDTSV